MANQIRFYFDQHIPVSIARGLRRRGVDVLTTQEVDRCGLPDLDQLAFATQQDRVLVTFDAHLLSLASSEIEHTGIAFCSAAKYSIGELFSALLVLHEVLSSGDLKNHVEFL